MGVLSECEPIRQKSKGKGGRKEGPVLRGKVSLYQVTTILQSVVRDKNIEIAGEKRKEKN